MKPSQNNQTIASTTVLDDKRFWAFIKTRRFGLAVALLSLIVVLTYVFAYTPYHDFVYSDMKSFWTRAIDRLNGQVFVDSQFEAWPPMYHIMLAEIFRVLRWIGLNLWIRIETPLTINIVAFAVSVYALQRMAVRWFVRPEFVLATVLLYAFGFPALYFNAFLLSDNLGGPLLVMAMSVAVCRKDWWAIMVAALLFGAATIIRPSLGPYGLAFVIFYLGQYGLRWPFIARAAVFSAVFFTAVFCASLEVSHISHGKVNGLSANGGLDFFIANADYHRIELNYDGWHFFIIVPALSLQPEHGVFFTSVPFYNQSYYFERGWEAVKHNPSRIWMNLRHVSDLFFADMLPSRPDAPGYDFFRPAWDWFKFGMFLTLGWYAWTWKALEDRKPAFLLFSTTLGLTLLVSYIFTGEPRYTYEIIFIFYLLSFKLVEFLRIDWRRWTKTLATYGGILALISAATAAVMMHKTDYPGTVTLSIEPQDASAPSDGKASLTAQKPVNIGRILFPLERDSAVLKYADDDDIVLDKPETVHLHTRFRVLGTKPLELSFRTYSSWPFNISMDGQQFMRNDFSNFFDVSEGTKTMAPGVHDIQLDVQYTPEEGGLAMNYVYSDGDRRVRQNVGLDSGRVDFLSLDSEPEEK
ncbi:MAG TPA: hypothetical protein VFW00_00350 [Rhodocyclaceae bacterium]|nr:hypothetical protein [Rhodocyclaceae bacterium]